VRTWDSTVRVGQGLSSAGLAELAIVMFDVVCCFRLPCVVLMTMCFCVSSCY
jgi:hypothetical protein